MDTPQNSINRRRSRPISTQHEPNQVQIQDPPLPCPRCDSTQTKFCYYNNYNLSQPRHFCKSCRRYWTQGGTLRPIPVGGGASATRKSLPVKRQRVKPQPKATTTDHVAAVSDINGSGPVVDLNEAWWSGLTTDGLFGPEVSYGLGVLDWPMEKIDECSSSIIPWSEIGILTPSNDLN